MRRPIASKPKREKDHDRPPGARENVRSYAAARANGRRASRATQPLDAAQRHGGTTVTADELLVHWREVLTVPGDEDPVTRRFATVIAATLFQFVSRQAKLLGTPRPTPRQLKELADSDRRLADATRILADAEARGVDLSALPQDQAALEALKAEEARGEAIEARVRRGELVEKADVIAAIDRALLAGLQVVRTETRKVRQHLDGDWNEEQIQEWWTPIAERVLLDLEAPFRSRRRAEE